MSVIISCKGCSRKLRVQEKHFGCKVCCPHCKVAFVAADNTASSAATTSSSQAPVAPDHLAHNRPFTLSRPESHACTIRRVFPLVPESTLGALIPNLSPNASVGSLLESDGASRAFDLIADWMVRKPFLCVGASLPGLWQARDEPFRHDELPGRVVAALARLTIESWGEVIELTPSMLLDIRGFGEGSLHPFLAVAARISAEKCFHEPPPKRCPVINLFEPRCFPPRPNAKISELRRLAEWAVIECNAGNAADLMAALSQPDLPEDVRLIRESFCSASLAELFRLTKREPMEQLFSDLAGILDRRTRVIFFARISLNSLRTLEDIAGEFGLTKERVRQLWVRSEGRIRDALTSPRFAPLLWRAHRLTTRLGTAVPPEHVSDILLKVSMDVSEPSRERFTDLLLWLAGPYSWDSTTKWLKSSEVPQADIVASSTDDRGHVDVERVYGQLSAFGLRPDVHSIWLDRIGKVKNIEGHWLLWNGSVPDKAAMLLEIWGEPATPEAIVTAIAEGHELRSSRTRLFDDDRFMRVDMTRIGLRSWGMEEYSTIAEEIEQELQRRGGVSDVGDLISTLVQRFNIRESSVKVYINAPMFILDGQTLRRRTSLDPYPSVRPITDSPSCYLLDQDTLSWRVEITSDTLRGSGRPLPIAIAGWLGIVPGRQQVLKADGGAVRITWAETSPTGPALGSIRFLAESVGARIGDQALLCLRRVESTVSIARIDQHKVDAASDFERIALLTGVPNEDGEATFLHVLGQALGCRGTRAAITAALKLRGETNLAALIPAETVAPDLDAAIDAMKDLF